MMQQLGQYVISLTAAALISGILLSFFREGIIRSLIRFLCGIFLIVTALASVANFGISDFSLDTEAYFEEGKRTAAVGADLAEMECSKRIKEQLEAYISSKAMLMGYELSVQMKLNQAGSPESVILSGSLSDSAKNRIEDMITSDLGIPKENQTWTG